MEQQLNICFATLFSLYLKTHRFHWLVKGTDFPQLHELFGDQYTAVWESLDNFAERINFHHFIPSSTYEDLQNQSAVKISSSVPGSLEMVKELMNDHTTAIDNLNQLFDIVEQTAGDQALMNFIADLLDQHQKHRWMLENILNVQTQINSNSDDEQQTSTVETAEITNKPTNVLGSQQGNHMRSLLDIFK
jgi:starvation-inducible DNA-binding protein